MRFFGFAAGCMSLACLFSSGDAMAQSQVVAGPVCGSPSAICYQFSAIEGLPATVLKQVFTAPSAGTATVSVQGSMQCVNKTDDTSLGVVDIAAQIVPNNGAPVASGPGGQRFAMRLPPFLVTGPFTGRDYSYPITIGSSRVVPVARGANTFRYKLVANRMDLDAECSIFSAQMTIHFTP